MRLLLVLLVLAWTVPGQTPRNRPLVYGGNSAFAPYEFLDERGEPQGFSVELVRAISRATGVPIEIRLAPWTATLQAFEAGEVDFVSLTRTPARAAQYDFLSQYWTHRYIAAFLPGRASYPRRLTEMKSEILAIQRDSVLYELVAGLPVNERPGVVTVTDISESIPLLQARQVTAILSSELTVRLAAIKHNLQLESVTLHALPFHFVARKGEAAALASVTAGFEKVRSSGRYEEILERWVVDILPPSAWQRYGWVVILLAVSALLGFAGITAWNRSLRDQVTSRTGDLERAVHAKQLEVEEHRLSVEALSIARKDREHLVNAIDGIVWERDVTWQDGNPLLNTRFVSNQAVRMLGFPLEMWLSGNRFWEERIHVDDRQLVLQTMHDHLHSGRDYRIEYRFAHAGGGLVWIRDVVRVSCVNGVASSLRGIMIDITAERNAVERLKESEHRYRELVEGSPDAILILEDDQILYVNPAGQQMLGAASANDLIGRPALELIHPDYRALVVQRHALVQQNQTALPLIEQKILRLDGASADVEASAAPFREGEKSMIRVILRDITKRKEAEQQLIHQAFHDPLTQLPNRALLFERLRHRMALADRFPGVGFAVLFLDLDRFKLVNDSLGHWMGDLLLLHVRERIQSVLAPWDTLARLGGDEFTILIEEVASRADVEILSDRIHAALTPAIEMGGHQIFVTASIGVALSATGYEEAEEVLRDADTAMYRAKALGRARTVFFDQQMRVSVIASLALERDLRLAAQSNQFALYYQPVVSLIDGKIEGVETLIRWKHPRRGLLLPGDFLASADEGGLILQLDSWALGEACREAKQWNWIEMGGRLSVNVSGRSLLLPDFSDHVRRILDQSGVEPRQLAMEITEQVLVESTQCISELERLRDAGVQFYLDDFGTGYSSLSYLTLFPISCLKIDRAFIRKLEEGGRELTVVRMVLALADGLGLEVIAEGVENERQAEILRSLGCHRAQGHYLGSPMDADSWRSLLRQVRTI